jgi:hypothetical protein
VMIISVSKYSIKSLVGAEHAKASLREDGEAVPPTTTTLRARPYRKEGGDQGGGGRACTSV